MSDKNKVRTVIDVADDLIKELGQDGSEAEMKRRIESFGEPKDFGELCKLYGLQTALIYIRGEVG